MASPAINMGRIVRKNSPAVFTFELPESGVAGQVYHQVRKLDDSGVHPVVSSAVVETGKPGTYQITVAAADMADGGIYYASIGFGTEIGFRLPAWSYAPANEFDKVIADLAALDAHLTTSTTTITGAITQAVTDINTSTNNKVDGAVTSINNNTDSKVSGAVTSINTSIGNAVTTIDNHTTAQVSGAVTALNTTIGNAKTSIETLITNETNAIDTKLISVGNDALAAKNASESLVGDFSAAHLDGQGQQVGDGRLLALLKDTQAKAGYVKDEVGTFSQVQEMVGGVPQLNQDGSPKMIGFNSLAELAGSAQFSAENKTLWQKLQDIKAGSQAMADELGIFTGPNFPTLAAMVGSSSFETANKTLWDVIKDVQDRANLLETEASASARTTALNTRLNATDTQLSLKYTSAQAVTDVAAVKTEIAKQYTATQGATDVAAVRQDIAGVKALLDSGLSQNAVIVPSVPSSLVSPLNEQVMRVSVAVSGVTVDGAGALISKNYNEDPDNQEVGIRLYMADGTGAFVEQSASHLFEDSAKAAALPACAGSVGGVPSTFKKMKREDVGQYAAYFKLDAYKHGNLQWEFQIVDSDPSGSPQKFSVTRYTEVRRMVTFTSFGGF